MIVALILAGLVGVADAASVRARANELRNRLGLRAGPAVVWDVRNRLAGIEARYGKAVADMIWASIQHLYAGGPYTVDVDERPPLGLRIPDVEPMMAWFGRELARGVPLEGLPWLRAQDILEEHEYADYEEALGRPVHARSDELAVEAVKYLRPDPGERLVVYEVATQDPETGDWTNGLGIGDRKTIDPAVPTYLLFFSGAEYLGSLSVNGAFRGAVRELLDWYVAVHPHLEAFTFAGAMAASEEWHRPARTKRGDPVALEVEGQRADRMIYRWPDGWMVVNVATRRGLAAEGASMGHCVGHEGGMYWQEVRDGVGQVWSLRDPTGVPHVTLEMHLHPRIPVQIQGVGNMPVRDRGVQARLLEALVRLDALQAPLPEYLAHQIIVPFLRRTTDGQVEEARQQALQALRTVRAALARLNRERRSGANWIGAARRLVEGWARVAVAVRHAVVADDIVRAAWGRPWSLQRSIPSGRAFTFRELPVEIEKVFSGFPLATVEAPISPEPGTLQATLLLYVDLGGAFSQGTISILSWTRLGETPMETLVDPNENPVDAWLRVGRFRATREEALAALGLGNGEVVP